MSPNMGAQTKPEQQPGTAGRLCAELIAWITAGRGRSAAVLALLSILGIASGIYGSSIKVDTDLRRLLPESAPSVRALDVLEGRKGSSEGFVIAIEGPTAADANAMVLAVSEEVASWPETLSLTVERDYTPLRAHALYMLELSALEDLRDELGAERRRAVARAMGPGLIEGGVDTSALVVGDDWDSGGEGWDEGGEDEELDWGSPGEGEEPEGEQPEAESPEEEPVELGEFLREQRQSLIDEGTLEAEEIALIWPEENEQGEVPWDAHVGRPYAANEGTIRTIHASLSIPATDVQFAQDIVGRVERRAAKLHAEGGVAETRVQVVAAYNVSGPVNTILRDAKRATWISGSLVLVVLLVGFRSGRVLPLILVPMAVAMGLTLVVAKISFGQLNALTVFLFAVLFGMGVDFSVHLYAQREHQGREADWPSIVRAQLRPLASTMATTSASLLVLLLAEFKAFREFGAISAAGVLLCFVAALILVPAIDTLLGPLRRAPREAARERGERPSTPGAPRASGFAAVFNKVRYVLLVLLAGVALYGAPKLAMEKDTRVLNASNASDAKKKQEISFRKTGGRYKSLTLIAESSEELDLVVDRLLELEASEERLPGGIDTGEPRPPWIKEVYSLRTVMPTEQEAKAEVIKDIARQTNDLLAELPDLDEDARKYQTHLEALEHMSAADPLRVDELPPWTLEPFRETNDQAERIAHVYLRIAGWSIDELIAVRARLDELLAGTQIEAADSRLVFADLMTLVENDAKHIPLYALAVILAFIAFDLRRIPGTAACFFTLTLGVVLAVAIMGLWPLRLNFFNLVVMPAVVGLGIDASIHLWHARGKSSLGATGKASLLAALTTVAGFSGLLAANNAGLRSIGEVGVMAIVTCVGVAFLALYPVGSRKD